MAIKNKYEFIMLFDVENGNPNGDPDAGNTPRIDPETGIGIVTDVCLKRKIRNYVELIKGGEEGYDILYKADRGLEDKFKEAIKSSKDKGVKANIKNKEARDYLCKRYFDARTFGTVIAINGEGSNHVTGLVIKSDVSRRHIRLAVADILRVIARNINNTFHLINDIRVATLRKRIVDRLEKVFLTEIDCPCRAENFFRVARQTLIH